MSSNGYLVPPSQDPSKEKLWTESWKRIDRFLPDLRKELALDVEQTQHEKAAEGADPSAPTAPATEEEKAAEKTD